jgi:hypothetical protein
MLARDVKPHNNHEKQACSWESTRLELHNNELSILLLGQNRLLTWRIASPLPGVPTVRARATDAAVATERPETVRSPRRLVPDDMVADGGESRSTWCLDDPPADDEVPLASPP